MWSVGDALRNRWRQLSRQLTTVCTRQWRDGDSSSLWPEMSSLSESESETSQTYCICKSTDVSRFMIGCDHCEDWFHGDCVHVTEKEARFIKRYYCDACCRLNPDLAIVYRSKSSTKERPNLAKEIEAKKKRKEERRQIRQERAKRKQEKEERKKERQKLREERQRQPSGHKDEEDPMEQDDKHHSKGRRERMRKLSSSSASSSGSPSMASRMEEERQMLRDTRYRSTDEDDVDVWEPRGKARKVVRPVKPTQQPKKKPSNASSRQSRARKRAASSSESSSDELPRQCYGPNCINAARSGSKYCSDECGLSLASIRICQTLPDRIREWSLTPCKAEKSDSSQLERIRAKQDAVKDRLGAINRDFDHLEALIEEGKSLTVEKDFDDDDDLAEVTVHCITCGSSVQMATAIRHMERCYNKMESQTSFASKFKTQIEDHRMFCDYYNPKDQTYCKRLQVLCPEHNAERKVNDKDACGYPLTSGLFQSSITALCRRSKKSCVAHYSWEKIRRAAIDMERVKQWMKLDELIEKERQLKQSMSNRAGVLGLMLHSTFNHELDSRWMAAQRAAAQQRKNQQKHNQKPIN